MPAYGLHPPSQTLRELPASTDPRPFATTVRARGITMPSPITTSRALARTAFRGRQLQQRCGQTTADSSDTGLTTIASHGQGERLLRLRDVLAIVGMSRAHVYNLIKQELFPRPIALGSNCARWVQSEVQTWVSDSIVASRLTARDRGSHRTQTP